MGELTVQRRGAPPKVQKKDVKILQSYVAEAQFASSDWRQAAWRNHELYDGGDAQWTLEDWKKAEEIGVDPKTINRVFPSVNLILGSQALTRHNLMAKGRSTQDSETGQVMTEGLQFVMDQWDGEFLVETGFRDSTIGGFGCLGVTLCGDPRREKIQVTYRDWKEVDWDPFGSPWFDPTRTRYVFYHRWMDVEDLKAMFWEKADDLEDAYHALSGKGADAFGGVLFDEATEVEQYRRTIAGGYWADAARQRVRPVEMWYRLYQRAHFACFSDGRAIELNPEIMRAGDIFQAVRNSQEVVQAVVPHIYVCTFVGDLELHHDRSPFNHDIYPMVPFIAYLNRYNCPYGVPSQIAGQQDEINKRRSMALALLQKRRVIAEEDVVAGGDEELDALHEEANKLDGFVVVQSGKMNAFKIMEDHELFPSHVQLLKDSEREVQEIVGTNAEFAGYESNATSGVAMQQRKQQGATMIASLFENLRRSEKILGYQIGSNMQQYWTREKVLRVTDRLTGSDRFVALNQVVPGEGGAITVRNDITQGKFDYIVSQAPPTDTVREQYLNLIIEWVKKTPPEVVPLLLSIAFELMDLPNKDQIMLKLKPLLGQDPRDEGLDPQVLKQKAIEELEAQKQAAADAAQLEQEGAGAKVRREKLEGDKIEAQIRQIDERLKIERARAVNEIHNKPKQEMAKANLQASGNREKAAIEVDKAQKLSDLKVRETKVKVAATEQAAAIKAKSAEHAAKLQEKTAEHGAKIQAKTAEHGAKLKEQANKQAADIQAKKAKAKPKDKPAAKR